MFLSVTPVTGVTLITGRHIKTFSNSNETLSKNFKGIGAEHTRPVRFTVYYRSIYNCDIESYFALLDSNKIVQSPILQAVLYIVIPQIVHNGICYYTNRLRR